MAVAATTDGKRSFVSFHVPRSVSFSSVFPDFRSRMSDRVKIRKASARMNAPAD